MQNPNAASFMPAMFHGIFKCLAWLIIFCIGKVSCNDKRDVHWIICHSPFPGQEGQPKTCARKHYALRQVSNDAIQKAFKSNPNQRDAWICRSDSSSGVSCNNKRGCALDHPFSVPGPRKAAYTCWETLCSWDKYQGCNPEGIQNICLSQSIPTIGKAIWIAGLVAAQVEQGNKKTALWKQLCQSASAIWHAMCTMFSTTHSEVGICPWRLDHTLKPDWVQNFLLRHNWSGPVWPRQEDVLHKPVTPFLPSPLLDLFGMASLQAF